MKRSSLLKTVPILDAVADFPNGNIPSFTKFGLVLSPHHFLPELSSHKAGLRYTDPLHSAGIAASVLFQIFKA